MITRRWAAVACVGVAALMFTLGAATRPLLVADSPDPSPVLTSIEIGFAQDMLAHHTQALIMVSRLDPGADPAVLGLARRLEDTQRGEIGQMQGWLRLAGAPLVNPDPMAWMHEAPPSADHHAVPEPQRQQSATMPGMATQADLDALSAARGRDASVLFLQLMRRHHLGGVAMAQSADQLITGGVVEQAARDMGSSQGQEIGLMGLLLSSVQS
ncbi:DUF305 domain-containing protein [Nocardia sp. NPDC057668]|uniref:DUF305 domain-containing protein n=1 Tax=Nocardia sp. NPDC057668 TaxID=3346202 RepID=UPI00366B8596